MSSSQYVPQHMLSSGIFHPSLRKLQEPNTLISAENVMYPMFLVENDEAIEPVSGMPGVYRYGITELLKTLGILVDAGLQSILLFGIVEGKDMTGSQADHINNPIVRGLPIIRAKYPSLLVACDVCLCPYTSHGHCGILTQDSTIDNVKSVNRIAEIALTYAKAGAQIVAPSDMMDGRIRAIKDVLYNVGLHNQVAVLSYSCKFASSLYGPFRSTMKSSPLSGDRKCYQLPPGSAGLAARAAARDVAEGADFLMVKPGLPYLDIIRQTKDSHPHHPLYVYQVSGEYMMIKNCGDEDAVLVCLLETLTCMRRAGADCIITYFAPTILKHIRKQNMAQLHSIV